MDGWFGQGMQIAHSMQPYIILYNKTTLQLGVRNLPKVFTRQRPGRESNLASTSMPPSHRLHRVKLTCILVLRLLFLMCPIRPNYHISKTFIAKLILSKMLTRDHTWSRQKHQRLQDTPGLHKWVPDWHAGFSVQPEYNDRDSCACSYTYFLSIITTSFSQLILSAAS